MSTNKAVGVELQDLVKIFPAYGSQTEFTAVNHVSLTVEPGEMVTLLGPSGCGKTTILRMIAGFETPTSGCVLVDGKDISHLPPHKRNVGMMFQSYALFPHLSVYENVAYGLKIKKMPSGEIKDRVENVLELMKIGEFTTRMPNQLSGGQQQRVALARAVVAEPSVLLFDEPLSNLDAKLREYMRDELRKIQKSVGITSVYVTHDQSEAMAISDKVVVMRSGVIEQVGTATGIYTAPENCFVANFMGKANFLRAEDVRGGEGTVLGQRVKAAVSGRCVPDGENVLMLRPESMIFDPQGPFSSTVEEAVYMGQNMQYVLKSGDERFTMYDYRCHANGIFAPGDTIRWRMESETLRILPKEALQ